MKQMSIGPKMQSLGSDKEDFSRERKEQNRNVKKWKMNFFICLKIVLFFF